MGKLSRRKRFEAKQAALAEKVTPVALKPVEQAVVERAAKQAESLQPRFQADPKKFAGSTISWIRRAETEEPPYGSDSRKRDSWLQQFVMMEPHLAGVLSSIASIDSNRGWTLQGGRNQVRRFTNALHNFTVANDIKGWRPGVRSMSYGFRGTDFGGAAEIERDGEQGPFTGFYSLDPAQCQLTSTPDFPLKYYPPSASGQRWQPQDYLRVTDIGHNAERFNGLGWCGTSRALELAKVMVGILMHDQEQLAVRAMKGLLLLKGISQGQWETAMAAREANLTQKELKYYGAVEVLASEQDEISAVLVALSNLPGQFNLETFTNLTMFGYALCYGYDAREFWPVSGGALGTATETEVQHQKATDKGAGDFYKAHQEQIQRPDMLPDTVLFLYEERNIQGQMEEVTLRTAQAQMVSGLYETGLSAGQPLLAPDVETARQRALQLLAESNVIPEEWTEFEEQVTATDDEDAELRMGSRRDIHRRDELLASDHIFRAAQTFGWDQIVRYQWPSNRVKVLARSGDHLLQRRMYPARNQTPSLAQASRMLQQAEQLAEKLVPAPAIRQLGQAVMADFPEETAMPQLSLVIRQDLSATELAEDIDRQITALRAQAQTAIERKVQVEQDAARRQSEAEERQRQTDETLAVMRQLALSTQALAQALADQKEPTIVIQNPPAPPTAPQPIHLHATIQMPPRGKQRVHLITDDQGNAIGAEAE